jgi:hypothetical protein
VDATLFNDHINGRALTAVLHLINGSPIDWYCKRQATVEAAIYGSEFVAARTAVNQIVDSRHMMRYLGVPILDKPYMFGENKSVIVSFASPNSPLKNQHHALAYHRVQEEIAAGFLAFYHIDGNKNPADILCNHWTFVKVWSMLKYLLFWRGETIEIPSTVAIPQGHIQDKGE